MGSDWPFGRPTGTAEKILRLAANEAVGFSHQSYYDRGGHPQEMKCYWWLPGVVAVTSCSLVRVQSLVRGPWRTNECRYEHEPQIPLRLVLPPAASYQ